MSSASIGSGSHVERRVLHQLVIPVVAPVLHRAPASARRPALHDDDVLDRRRVRERLVGHLLERHDLAAAIAAVGGDEQRGLRVVDAIAQRLGAEAAEDDAVDRADARAREHRDRELGNQRHVERDAIALA